MLYSPSSQKFTKRKQFVAIDYLLRNIVLKLWQHGICTWGVDQGSDHPCFSVIYNKFAYITCANTRQNIKTLVSLFGPEKTTVILDPLQIDLSKTKLKKDKITIRVSRSKKLDNGIGIFFHPSMIPWIHQKLNIRIPKEPNYEIEMPWYHQHPHD